MATTQINWSHGSWLRDIVANLDSSLGTAKTVPWILSYSSLTDVAVWAVTVCRLSERRKLTELFPIARARLGMVWPIEQCADAGVGLCGVHLAPRRQVFGAI